MITINKLNEYEAHFGDTDLFYLSKVAKGINITSEDEWYLIKGLIQDFSLIRKGLASRGYTEIAEKKIIDNCDNIETINQLKKLSEKEW